MKHFVRWIFALAAAIALTAALLCGAQAQDFYGEGNVLIAVDMGPFRVNEEAGYPEGTMGTLIWGEDARAGTSTRPAFAPRAYTPTLGVVPAEEYEIETAYEVGQTLLFPVMRDDDPEYSGDYSAAWLPLEDFPEEVAGRITDCLILYKISDDPENNGTKLFLSPCVLETEDAMIPCLDFLEIECVAVTEYSTVWQYTGNAYSNRPGFDPSEYQGAVSLSAEELKLFTDLCDKAYRIESEIYGDPRREDALSDRDGKAAYVVYDFNLRDPYTLGFYSEINTDCYGFDCLVINPAYLPGRRVNMTYAEAEERFYNTLCHELNHYILGGCMDGGFTSWLGEIFAQNAVNDVRPENSMYLEHYTCILNECSRARMITGMDWGDEWRNYPPFKEVPYALGDLFLRYIDRRTTGNTSGTLWTELLAEQTPDGSLMNSTMDDYLRRTTGEGLEAWMAQFLAALITGAEEGPYAVEQSDAVRACRPDLRVFLRDWHDYGQYLAGFTLPGAADSYISNRLSVDYGFTAVSGGGTAFAYRNDAGGPISITGADDNWYFFAVTMELPDPDEVIEISGAEELARIGHDPAYPLSGHYILINDIDLGGGPENQWTPIGGELTPFIGVFDGNGRTIEGLYIDSGYDCACLFDLISGNAVIRDLTVKGSVSGSTQIGGIVGRVSGGTVTGCTSCVSVTGENSCGGIVGYHYLGVISDCTFSGTVTGGEACGGIAGYDSWGEIRNCRSFGTVTDVGRNAGGIVGLNTFGTVENCFHAGVVSCRADGTNAGGVAGMTSGGTIGNCYHTGDVSASNYVGGVIGWIRDDGILRNCYHQGTVASGGEEVGSVCGGIRTGSIENCYSLFPGLPVNGTILETGTVSSSYVLADEAGGEDTLTAEGFTHPENFTGWDFENVWSLENGVRPILRSIPETAGTD